MKGVNVHFGAQKFLAWAITVGMAAGCASTTVSNRQQTAIGYLPRPAQIWIYDFAATAADVPPESSLADQGASVAPQTAEEIDEGRKLASQISSQLVQQIRAMGLAAENGSAATRPQVNDLVIEGAIISVQQGSAAKRVAIGFSAGQSEMKVAVEGLQMTANGLRKLGSGDVSSAGNKTPGSAVGLAVLIATHTPQGSSSAQG